MEMAILRHRFSYNVVEYNSSEVSDAYIREFIALSVLSEHHLFFLSFFLPREWRRHVSRDTAYSVDGDKPLDIHTFHVWPWVMVKRFSTFFQA